MQGNHRISLGYSWVYDTLQSRHGLATSALGLSRWASSVGRHARSKALLAVRPGRSYVGMTGSLTSRGVISGV